MLAGGAEPVETELKLRLAPPALARLLRHPALRALKRGRARTEQLVGTYFDTDGQLLARAGIALRVRSGRGGYVQTVKGPAKGLSGGGLASRTEYEWPVPDNAIDLLVLAETPWQRTFARAQRQGGLAARFTTDITRTSIPLTFADSTMATACIDRGEIRAGHRRTPVCELELELEAGVATRLFELAHTLATELPLRVEVCSKAERGYRLAWPAPVAPAHAADIDLPRNADAGAALASIIRNCLRQIEANADGLLADADPEWVHQMRIGTRRLRSALALAHGRAPDAALAPVLSEVKWLARALGPARDLDVFALETLPALAAALRDSPLAGAIGTLAEQVAARRSSARRAGREHVASARFTLFLLATGALASDPRLGAPADGPESGAPAERDPLAIRARRFARRVLKRRHRKLRAATANLPTATSAERHVARIAAKKLRYAAEFFAPLFPGKRTRSFRKALTRLQEVLGQLNDATVAAALAREIAGAQVATAAAFDGWTAAQAAALGPELAAAWRAFERATPFWTDD